MNSPDNALITLKLRCEDNYLDIQEGSEIWTQAQVIEMRGGVAWYEPQKMRENFVLNANDVSALTQLANQGNNLAKLGWNLPNPETWEGIQWV